MFQWQRKLASIEWYQNGCFVGSPGKKSHQCSTLHALQGSRTRVVDASMPGHRTPTIENKGMHLSEPVSIVSALELVKSCELDEDWPISRAFLEENLQLFHVSMLGSFHQFICHVGRTQVADGGSAMLHGWRPASCTRIWLNFLTELSLGDGNNDRHYFTMSKNIVLDILSLAWQLQPYQINCFQCNRFDTWVAFCVLLFAYVGILHMLAWDTRTANFGTRNTPVYSCWVTATERGHQQSRLLQMSCHSNTKENPRIIAYCRFLCSFLDHWLQKALHPWSHTRDGPWDLNKRSETAQKHTRSMWPQACSCHFTQSQRNSVSFKPPGADSHKNNIVTEKKPTSHIKKFCSTSTLSNQPSSAP